MKNDIMQNDNMKFIMTVGYSVIVFLALIEIVSTIIFFTGASITKLNFWLSLVLTLILIFDLYKSVNRKVSMKMYFLNVLILAGIFIVGSFFAARFYDLSYNGQGYQQEAIIQLTLNNWNPIFGHPVDVIHELWINHSPKGPWILSAVFYSVTGMIETGKVFNFVLLISSFFITIGTLTKIFPNYRIKSILLAFVLAFNPVVLTQLTSFYIDGQIYSLLLIIFCMVYQLFDQYGLWEIVVLCFSILLLVNIKFMALVYACVIVLCYLLGLILFKKKSIIKRIIWPVVITFIISIAVIGCNPFVTNTITKGNPFYPFFGKDAVDIMTANSPANYNNHNQFISLAHSLFAKSENPVTPESSKKKMPFTIKKEELEVFMAPDVRAGGFGPLFSGALVVTALLFLISLALDWKKTRYIILPGIILLISVLVNPESWWARYSPQIWVAPILIVIFAFHCKKKVYSLLGWGIVAIMLVNTLLVSKYHFTEQNKYSRQVDAQLNALAAQKKVVEVKSGNDYSNRIRFEERNIKYNIVDTLTCEKKESFPFSETEYCK
ncbi:hypothetical protein [Neobacillus citreus]|uniref:Uncharacterized protein n=1 Tax=Neobacillus citreus TaxID=2833578 RepID=A0A942T2L0_9BACI|nr:hypothetical protein [Neobacillus citreus]MCH6269447.1 hypothetical protein [Neobacillus citreus]